MKPLVSILIPAYNKEKWIEQTIQSALRQTWDKKEIIVVDDGSKDNTLQIVRKYESNNLKIVSQENRGACAARNKALSYAQGDYIQWLDADDLLAYDKIEKQLERRKGNAESRVLLTSSWGKFYFCRERAKFLHDSLWQDLNPIDWILNRFNQNVWMNPSVWLISRYLCKAAGPWNEELTLSGDDDGEYICRVVKNSERIKFVFDSKCYYRIGNIDSLDHGRSKDTMESFVLAMRLCISHLLSLENSERTKMASLKYLQNWVPFFYYEMPSLMEEINEEAQKLGGSLNLKLIPGKYHIIEKLLGYKLSKRIKSTWNKYKMLSLKNVDQIYYTISSW